MPPVDSRTKTKRHIAAPATVRVRIRMTLPFARVAAQNPFRHDILVPRITRNNTDRVYEVLDLAAP